MISSSTNFWSRHDHPYRVSRVIGDRYAGEFPRELFRKHGIAYDLAKQTKSELFRDLLPLLNSGRIVLPHNDRLLRLSVAPARLAGTPSRIPTAATMTWQMPSPARQRSPNSADTTPACAGCVGRRRQRRRLAARQSSSLRQQRGPHPAMMEFCAVSHAESALNFNSTKPRWCARRRRRSKT